MSEVKIRLAEERDYEKILELNARDVSVLSPMDAEKLRKMAELTELFQVAEIDGKAAAFIMVFREKTDYWSSNYLWFDKHYDQFLYVDRIVVDQEARQLHIGRTLYNGLVRYAQDRNVPMITAEIDIEPIRNEPSLRFHQSMGFQEVGTRMYGTVKVSLQKLELR